MTYLNTLADATTAAVYLCATWILLRRWRQVDGRRYPRWTLITIGVMFIGFAVKRTVDIFGDYYPAKTLELVINLITTCTAFAGMVGQISLAGWVGERTSTINNELEDVKVQLTESENKVSLLEAQLAIAEAEMTARNRPLAQ